MPPPLQAQAFVFAVTQGDASRVSAFGIEALSRFTFRAQAADGDRVSVRYYSAPLAELQLDEGELAAARAGELARPLPASAEVYVARAGEGTLGGWVRAELTGDPLAQFQTPCGTRQHDGGGGACAPLGACNPGYYLRLDGACEESCDAAAMQVLDCDEYPVMFESDDLGSDARPRLGDADGDGKNELLVTAYNQLTLFSIDGLTIHSRSTLPLGATVQAAYGIGIGDADGDGLPDIIVGSWHSDLFQLAAHGSELTQERTIPLLGYGHWMVEVLDIDGVPGNEVLLSNRYGHFHALRWDGQQYRTYYTSPTIGQPTNETGKSGICGIGDTDGDGHLEVLTYSTLGLLDLWKAGTDGFVNQYHLAFPTSGTDGADDFRAALGDIDGDGRDEIFYADEFGVLHALRYDGTSYSEEWTLNVNLKVTTMIVADVDPDPAKELVMGSESGATVVIDLATRAVTHLAEFGAPSRWLTAGDLDGDGKDELFVGYDSGFLRVFRHR